MKYVRPLVTCSVLVCAASFALAQEYIITTVAGNGTGGSLGDNGSAVAAELRNPEDTAVDAAGNLYIADTQNNRIRKVTPAGIITTFAGNGQCSPLNEGGLALEAGICSPVGLFIDASGVVYVSQRGDSRVRKITTAGIITTVAGTGAGGYNGDNVLANTAQLYWPTGLTLDSDGNLYIADSFNHRIRKVSVAGVITTVAGSGAPGYSGDGGAATTAKLNYPSWVAVNAAGDLFISDRYNLRIRKVTGGIIATVAGSGAGGFSGDGGAATAAGISFPDGVEVDAAGNLLIADQSNQRIRRVNTSGVISTIAGNGTAGFTGDGGPATSASLSWPATVKKDAAGNLFIADSFNNRVRKLSPSSGTSAPVRFVPVAPCRIVDTRAGQGTTDAFGPPSMAAGGVREFPLPTSPCGLPAAAKAYSLNVTAVPTDPLYYLTIWPTGQPQPFVSTLNSFDGSVVANAAIVPAGVNGSVSVYVTSATDVVIDVNGYFVQPSGDDGFLFYSLAPCRVVDTRPGQGPTGFFGPPSMAANGSRTFPMPLSPCGIPDTAKAFSLNATVVPPGALSYLTLWPSDKLQPLVSTLNSFLGKVVANAALVPAGSNGLINAFVTNTTDLILDINGYFGPPGRANALSFYPVTPCRVADTRVATTPFGAPTMAAGSTRAFAIPSSSCSIPSTAQAYSLNFTAVPAGTLAYLTAWPTGFPQPLVSTLNSFDGRVVANAAIVPAGANGAVSVFVSHTTDVVIDINGYFAP